MNSLIIFAVFVMAAYIFQMFLGWQQLKDFNKTYTMLRKLGRVAVSYTHLTLPTTSRV